MTRPLIDARAHPPVITTMAFTDPVPALPARRTAPRRRSPDWDLVLAVVIWLGGPAAVAVGYVAWPW